MPAHWIDFTIIAIIALSILTGLFRGFVKELVALSVWILAIWLSYHYSEVITPLLEPWIKDPAMRMVLSFVLMLVGTLITGGIVNAVISFLLKRTGMSGTDRALGMLFGFVRGVCIVALMIIGIQMTSLPVDMYRNESLLYDKFEPLVQWMQGYMPDFIKKVQEADVKKSLDDAESSLTFLED